MNKVEITRFAELDYACSEALNTLCANLSFVGSGKKKIMITSSRASEGKSFLAMNMMRTLAALGRKVVLVDADLRRSLIVNRYGVRLQNENHQGLAHYLAGMCALEDILCSTDIVGAYMVTSGREVSNSLSLLTTPLLATLLDTLARDFDVVLIDAPPVGVIIDAAEIAKSCDGTLLIVSYNETNRRELSESKKQIERTGCPVLGAVLNNVTFDTLSSKKYYYSKYYYSHYAKSGERTEKKPRRWLKSAK